MRELRVPVRQYEQPPKLMSQLIVIVVFGWGGGTLIMGILHTDSGHKRRRHSRVPPVCHNLGTEREDPHLRLLQMMIDMAYQSRGIRGSREPSTQQVVQQT